MIGQKIVGFEACLIPGIIYFLPLYCPLSCSLLSLSSSLFSTVPSASLIFLAPLAGRPPVSVRPQRPRPQLHIYRRSSLAHQQQARLALLSRGTTTHTTVFKQSERLPPIPTTRRKNQAEGIEIKRKHLNDRDKPGQT